MTAEDVQNIYEIAHVAMVCIGFLAGLSIGQAFSFWKW
ncbi:hypothetical protein HMPREF1141_1099 [Clostridium sp. MSTE9]|nr:hypothetical protein HMPREF1141_1099 [Clostridium sp. MSTE9]